MKNLRDLTPSKMRTMNMKDGRTSYCKRNSTRSIDPSWKTWNKASFSCASMSKTGIPLAFHDNFFLVPWILRYWLRIHDISLRHFEWWQRILFEHCVLMQTENVKISFTNRAARHSLILDKILSLFLFFLVSYKVGKKFFRATLIHQDTVT